MESQAASSVPLESREIVEGFHSTIGSSVRIDHGQVIQAARASCYTRKRQPRRFTLEGSLVAVV
jgi:hypothetical protein